MGSDRGAWAADPETNLDLGFIPQGISAELISEKWNISREDNDRFSVQSHQRAAAARLELAGDGIVGVELGLLGILDIGQAVERFLLGELSLGPIADVAARLGFGDAYTEGRDEEAWLRWMAAKAGWDSGRSSNQKI